MSLPFFVVLSGCSGGGKSTLLEALRARGHAVREEPGRAVVQAELARGGDGLPWADTASFIRLCIERGIAAYESAKAESGPVFFDRSLLDAVAASARLFPPLAPEYEALPARFPYHRQVFLAPPWPEIFLQDGERQHGFEAAVEEYEALSRYYPDVGYEVALLPKRPVEDRADWLERQIGL